MARTDGRKIVGIAFAGIMGALGIGQIYLPFIADRDKLRGLAEEEDMPEQAKREMDMLMKAEIAAAEARQQGQQKGGGSMWSNLRRKEN
ncbi:hypothetical protein CTEN210_09282 [Chaetoceros tenuissimus]|uniref:Uncharacterized protein n=1 Tax=Chaetoceros tenuissimus TaxID=426638 RepID=A0AAD3CX74_9STRA|nr:hypothetical protein CTEN210_09282 [Chaetoceros tenuissimus]